MKLSTLLKELGSSFSFSLFVLFIVAITGLFWWPLIKYSLAYWGF